MKKHLITVVVLLSLLNSCKEDESELPITVEGTWKLTAWNSANAYDFNGDGITNTNLLKEFNCYHNEFMVFKADGTGIVKSGSFADVSATLVTGTENTYTYTIACIQGQDNSFFNWSRPNENTIVFTQNNGTDNLTLNGNKISFLVEEFVLARYNDTTHYPVVTEDLLFVYTKQ